MKKSVMIAMAAICLVIVAIPVALANYGEDNWIGGYVKEYRSLKPMPYAKVKLYRKTGTLKDTDKTNQVGQYKFRKLEEGTYKVKVSVPGYRNPRNFQSDTVSHIVKIDGETHKNLYLEKIPLISGSLQ